MDEILIPPDAVALTIDYLNDRGFPWDVEVRNRRPNPTQGRIVVVRRTGGVDGDLITDAPFITFECFADTPKDTADLAMHTYGLMKAMKLEIVNGVQVYRVQPLAAPADLYDADAQRDRYVFSMMVEVRVHPYLPSSV